MGLPPHNRTAEGDGWALYHEGSRWSANIMRDGETGFFGIDFSGRPDAAAVAIGRITLEREANSDTERARVHQALNAFS